MHKPYYLADPCPYCGQEDIVDTYRGARKGNSSWGHTYLCCSEACGTAFRNSPQHINLECERLRKQIARLQDELRMWEGQK